MVLLKGGGGGGGKQRRKRYGDEKTQKEKYQKNVMRIHDEGNKF